MEHGMPVLGLFSYMPLQISYMPLQFSYRIPVKILKDAINLLSKPLTLIYNASLERGIFPQIWKLARVTPIFFFFIHNLKIYNLTKHIYKNDTIGSMIGMATLNDLLTKNQYRY